jgi:hypothetical protein
MAADGGRFRTSILVRAAPNQPFRPNHIIGTTRPSPPCKERHGLGIAAAEPCLGRRVNSERDCGFATNAAAT